MSNASRKTAVIGEDELSETDKAYMSFGAAFEKHFLNQGFEENRSIDDTLNLAWDLLCMLPVSELDRMSEKLISENYDKSRAERFL